jgi:hypothetical protein
VVAGVRSEVTRQLGRRLVQAKSGCRVRAQWRVGAPLAKVTIPTAEPKLLSPPNPALWTAAPQCGAEKWRGKVASRSRNGVNRGIKPSAATVRPPLLDDGCSTGLPSSAQGRLNVSTWSRYPSGLAKIFRY